MPMSSMLAALAAVVFSLAPSAAPPQDQQFAIPGSGGTWVVNAADRTDHAKITEHLGRQALLLRAGTHVVRTGLEFENGTIEFDIAPMAGADFAAITFRRQSIAEHENVYLRLSRSGEFMALQYAPRVGAASTWQLYPEFNTTVSWPAGQWTHVRLEVSGRSLAVHVGDAAKPVLVVPRMRHTSSRGQVGVWARVNDKPDAWAAAIANLEVRAAPSAAPAAPAIPPPPSGFLDNWNVAGAFPLAGAMTVPPDGIAWKPACAEESGLINLNRLVNVKRGRFVTYARLTLQSDAARRVKASIGYSDDVTVFLDGQALYEGQNGWESRSPGFASFVDTRFEHVWLPLKAGANELVLAIADDQRFGWGFAVRLEAAPGVRPAAGPCGTPGGE